MSPALLPRGRPRRMILELTEAGLEATAGPAPRPGYDARMWLTAAGMAAAAAQDYIDRALVAAEVRAHGGDRYVLAEVMRSFGGRVWPWDDGWNDDV